MNDARALSGDLKAERRKFKTQLPDYTRGEEITNMITHIIGAAFAIAAIPLLIVTAAMHHNPWAVVSGAIYGATLLIMFTVSSVYHGLPVGNAKRVMRVIDHCDIYFLIAGTYTPILLAAIRPLNPALAWSIFGVEWALTAIAVTLNAIDLKRFEKVSMVCYIGMGWCVIAVLKLTIEAMTLPGFMLLLAGGIAYTVGAVLYGIGKKKRYFHSVFHVFVIIGSLLQFFAILFYVM
ncbi:MAG: hemolysin III family protein [Ruminococcus sp.]|uniref:PAQR family membrane homeostasis protein TrhA n=1 Tax=Ruminococcus sp. TaxID=41978 RepID=UPI0028736627|nr:hemolysin III family protein [Ruminococcus sp.]MBQ3284898.1 hemolysin III family protein [Ruminococcus sp.]